MSLSKAIEKRMWPFDHPMTQFPLSRDLLFNLQRHADEVLIPDLAASNAEDLGQLIHMNHIHGAALLAAARQFPTISIRYKLLPLSQDLLKIRVDLEREFDWDTKNHGHSEPFWVWVEDYQGVSILQWASVLFRPSTEVIHLEFIVPVRAAERVPFVTIRTQSDRWMGAEDAAEVSFEDLIMPVHEDTHTPLLDLPYLQLSALGDERLQAIYSGHIAAFNAIQTQAFWSAYKSQENLLVCAPGASGKSLIGELAIW